MCGDAGGSEVNAIEDFDHRSYSDKQACFLEHFALDGGNQGLAHFDGSARQTPLSLERWPAAPHHEHAFSVDDRGANSDDGSRRKCADVGHRPNALTTTRLRR